MLGIDGQSERIFMPMEITKANTLIAACLKQEAELHSLYSVIGALLEVHGELPAAVVFLDMVNGRLGACLEYSADGERRMLVLEAADGVALSVAGEIPLWITPAGLRQCNVDRRQGADPARAGSGAAGTLPAGAAIAGAAATMPAGSGDSRISRNVIPFPVSGSAFRAGQAR